MDTTISQQSHAAILPVSSLTDSALTTDYKRCTHLLDDTRDVVLVVPVLQRQRSRDVLAVELLVDEKHEMVPHVAFVEAHDVFLTDRLEEVQLPQTVVGSGGVVRDDLNDARSSAALLLRLHVTDERETTAETYGLFP